jgi:glucose-6-phosphate dehydrogenase assembly protein OpcA
VPNTYKVLGQSCPANTSDTTLYTVPSATQTVVSSIVVANITATNYTYRIAIRPAGATIANQHYQAYDVTVAANDSVTLVLGITLGATDVITVRSSNANSVSFSAYGCEIT